MVIQIIKITVIIIMITIRMITYKRAMVWFLLRNQPPSSQRPGRSQAGPDNTIVTNTDLIWSIVLSLHYLKCRIWWGQWRKLWLSDLGPPKSGHPETSGHCLPLLLHRCPVSTSASRCWTFQKWNYIRQTQNQSFVWKRLSPGLEAKTRNQVLTACSWKSGQSTLQSCVHWPRPRA